MLSPLTPRVSDLRFTGKKGRRGRAADGCVAHASTPRMAIREHRVLKISIPGSLHTAPWP